MEVVTQERARIVPALRFPPTKALLLTGAVLLVFVVALGFRLQSVRGPVGVDARAAAHIDTPTTRFASQDTGYHDVVQLSEGPLLVVVLLLVCWSVRRNDVTGAVVAVAGPITAMVLAEAVFKPLVERRFAYGELSYPSGHVTATAAVAAAAVLLIFRYAGPGWALVSSPLAALVSAAVGVAVIGAGWHYATDSAGGIALGCGVLCVVAALVDVVARLSPGQAFRPT